MNNNVVLAICDAATTSGWTALRFNFRGVGASLGRSEGGTAEIDDVREVVRAAAAMPGLVGLPLVLAGYSFGAWASWHAAPRLPALAGVLLVSPPVQMMDHDFRLNPRLPLSLAVGDRDQFCRPANLTAALHSAGRTEIPLVERGADHFWVGHEQTLVRLAGDFLAGIGLRPTTS